MINSLKKNFYENLSLFYAVYFIIFILFLTTIAPIITTSSATTYWSNYQEKSFASGSGTSSDPYIITTPGQLYYFFSSNKNAYGKLGTTLDLSAHMWDSPEISTEKINLDGDGKSILNLQSNSIYCGLIGKNTNSNSEITFNNLTIKLKYSGSSSSQYGGGLVGYTDGTVNLNKCVADGTITASFSNFIGGFIGRANYLNATQCLNYVSMYVTDGNVGGICGYVNISATLKLCGNNGDLTTNKTYAGGLIANCGSLTVNECFNSGIITANNGYVGGLFGSVTSSSNYTLTDVYNSGIITGNYAGGLIAFSNKKVTLNNAYNTGDVVSTKNTGVTYAEKTLDGVVNNQRRFILDGSTISNIYNSNISIDNDKNLAETYGTGGGGENEDFYLFEVIKKIRYVDFIYDVSLVNGKNKILSKNNVYSVKPSSYDETTTNQIGIYVGFCGVNGSYYREKSPVIYNLNSASGEVQKFALFSVSAGSSTGYVIDKDDHNLWWTFWGYNYNSYQYNKANVVHMHGIAIEKNGNELVFSPVMHVLYSQFNGSGYYLGSKEGIFVLDEEYQWGKYRCDIPEIPKEQTYYDKDYIKSNNFGNNFAVNENINGGMPYLKNFYWQ